MPVRFPLVRPALFAAVAVLAVGLSLPVQADDKAALAAAAKESGTTVFPDGIVYRALKEGTGTSPVGSDVVKVNYKGMFTNGKVFDASASHGGPIEFPLNRVIRCWTEGVQKMKVGGKAKLTCPSETAYGSRGAGDGAIPADSTLVFEVELVGIQGK